MVDVILENGELDIIIDFFDEYGDKLYNSLVAVIIDIIHSLRNFIITGKLSGQVLRRVTGKLMGSIGEDIFSDSASITGLIYQEDAAAPYGRIHEFGGTYSFREYLRNTKHGVVYVRGHEKTYPERSFMRSAMADSVEDIKKKLRDAVEGVR